MIWLRTILVIDKGEISKTSDWNRLHESYVRAIKRIDSPENSGLLTIRKKTRRGDGQWNRNGVTYLKNRFLKHMQVDERWEIESPVSHGESLRGPLLRLFPTGEAHRERVTSTFGGFDFNVVTEEGFRAAIEWETGNISSSHRSMNKLAIALMRQQIHAGVLVVPSRALYDHLTDRVGNIDELSGYLAMWEALKIKVRRGLLAISVVEHDALSDDQSIPYLRVGEDGRSKEGRAKRR